MKELVVKGDAAMITPTELKIIKEVANGSTSKEVAAKLNISLKTVEVHRHNVMKKTGAGNFIQLIIALYKKGIIE
jgi:DNA-binding NarL/FixJ family response regulator